MSRDPNNLVWMDLEMTGLDPARDSIIEIATIITGPDLDVVAEGPALAIHQPEFRLERMDEWNTTHHARSGLLDRVRESDCDVARAQHLTLEFIREHVPPGESPLCGNSIWQDRRFLVRWMPELDQYCHYRVIDVSTVKELCKRWAPEIAAGVVKGAAHRAQDDIRESIAELRHYREHFLRPR